MEENRKSKKIYVILFVILFVILCIFILVGCIIKERKPDMPFNGDISFYDLSIEIPKDFIRDSMQSNDNQYVFEKNNYDVIIVLSKQDTNGYSLRNLVNTAKSENGMVIYFDSEYTTCDIEYMLSGGMYSFSHSHIYNGIRYQIVVQSKDEANAKSIYDELIANAIIGENEN